MLKAEAETTSARIDTSVRNYIPEKDKKRRKYNRHACHDFFFNKQETPSEEDHQQKFYVKRGGRTRFQGEQTRIWKNIWEKNKITLTEPRSLITKEAVTKVFFVLVKFLAKKITWVKIAEVDIKKSVVLWEMFIECRQHYYSLRIKIYKLFIYLLFYYFNLYIMLEKNYSNEVKVFDIHVNVTTPC